MPIRHEFVLKTVVRSSDNITPTETIYNNLSDLRKDSIITAKGQDASFEILVVMKGNAIVTDYLDIEGELTDFQTKKAGALHADATDTIKSSAGPGGRIKLRFVIKT
jgi:hypothetical protein